MVRTAESGAASRLHTRTRMGGSPLAQDFYLRPTLVVARELLGKIFLRHVDGDVIAGRIVEVEAYTPDGDAASHAFRGRTQRNAAMFEDGGVLYVYFTYGMHYCMNVVTETAGRGAAVLIRAIEPFAGEQHMLRNRGAAATMKTLSNGPAKCCQAFGIGPQHNGIALHGRGDIVLLDAPAVDDAHVARSPRVGIRLAAELPWRLYIRGNPHVSRGPREHIDVPVT